MFRPNKLLKVVSVLMIIFGILGLVFSIIGYVTMAKASGLVDQGLIDQSVIDAAMNPVNIATSMISTICCIAAGFFGRGGKNYKGAVITAGIYTGLMVISTVMTIVGGTFTFISVFGYIIPLLYWWGLYQSKE